MLSQTIDPSVIFDADHYAANGYPHEAWAALRRDDPVHLYEHKAGGIAPFWAITRHQDIMEITRNARTFINSKGVLIPDRKDVEPDFDPTELLPMLLMMDPPKHGKYRGVVRDRFTAQSMMKLQEHILAKCEAIADDVAARRLEKASGSASFDFVEAVAAKLPMDVIAELFGVPPEDREEMIVWSNAVTGSQDAEYGDVDDPHSVVWDARRKVFEYFSQHVADRRANPKDDFVSLLVEARVDGEPLSDLDILGFCFMLMIAGNETTRNGSSGALLALFDHPAEMKRLALTPDLMDTAIDELLRWVSPVIYSARTATEDTELRGRKISKGQMVAMFYASANRDEEAFEAPLRFDLSRTPNEHLAFGFGRHRCLGNELARIEMRAILGTILKRFPEIRLAGEPARLRSTFVGGIKRLPVAVS